MPSGNPSESLHSYSNLSASFNHNLPKAMTKERYERSVNALIDKHRMHIYETGVESETTLVFMSGSGTVSPVHDFKILYEKLSGLYRIIVIEKFGYGESDLYEISCEIDTLVSIQRQALLDSDQKGPYILVPHSMSGLEAIRWKQLYPEEVKAIIGLDMATPQTYREWSPDMIARRIRLMKRMRRYLDHGLLFWFPLNTRGLTKEEIRRQRQLWKRNAFNKCFVNEAEAVIGNAQVVESAGMINCPILMFVSNGKEVSSNWRPNCQKFALLMNAEMVYLDCGHYVHHYESESISRDMVRFLTHIDCY